MNTLPTESYKGVRDFYPEDMQIQKYIFDTWTNTSRSFGFEQYDASILEPSALYKAKGAENEEMVNDQTYSFKDRGGRDVTLRPEMTPTVARMVAARSRDLTHPVKWFSIPNLFRYERTQRGRLREHWQLNCDIFGAESLYADIEIIQLAHSILIDFGASEDMFEIKVNNRLTMQKTYELLGIHNPEIISKVTRINDQKKKISSEEYVSRLSDAVKDTGLAEEIKNVIESEDQGDNSVVTCLRELGIKNVSIDRSLARGFDYYTGTIFEVFDKSPDGSNRSMIGGGRYDNLTKLFNNDGITGIGFGMGDVTMKDFLETHKLLPDSFYSKSILHIITLEEKYAQYSLILAQKIRNLNTVIVKTDYTDRKIEKKIKAAHTQHANYIVRYGENEHKSKTISLEETATRKITVYTEDELIVFFKGKGT